DTEWMTYSPEMYNLEEGDDLRTAEDSYGQFDFGDCLHVILLPGSEIHCEFTSELEGVVTSELVLDQGKAAFMVDLHGTGSKFTLRMTDGAGVVVNPGEKTVFHADSTGKVRVFSGRVSYYPHEIGQGTPIMLKANMTNGLETIFDHSVFHHPRALLTAIARNSKGATMGFDTTGNFVATGELKGFVFRLPDKVSFYLYDEDSKSISFELRTVKAGRFELHFLRYTTEPVGFAFKNMDTSSSNTIFLRFQNDHEKDRAYIRSISSNLSYDMEISYRATCRFCLHDMTLNPGEGHSYEILNYERLDSTDINSVRIGLDEDGDESSEDKAKIHTGMSGSEVDDSLREGDDESSILQAAFCAVVFIIFIAVMIFVLRIGGGYGREP
ncbi:MAG: hypothetical protein KAU14_05705, partial [Thermoplasmata archaeon]|nr:hypothetical protein [Thermoplasmata archaeon]